MEIDAAYLTLPSRPKTDTCANSVDPDGSAHNEQSCQDPHFPCIFILDPYTH